MNNKLKKMTVGLAMAVSLSGVAGMGIASAQGPLGSDGPQVVLAPMMCSATNYTDVAAKALGIQSAALRQALVSGKSLEQVATSKQVSLQTVEDALKAAYETDLAQALKDGLISQQIYDQVKGRLDQTQSNATPAATPQADRGGRRPGGPVGRFLNVSAHNVVNPFLVTSKAIGISCADLVKAMQGGQSIAQVAASKNVQAQTVIDALVSADKAAITQDVQEGLVAQAQADGQIAQVTNRAGSFIYSALPRGREGFGFGGPGGPGNDFPDGPGFGGPGGPGNNFPDGGPRSNDNGNGGPQVIKPANNN